MNDPYTRPVMVGFLVASVSVTLALTRAPTQPLAERVENAEQVFVGTLVNRVEEGEWVQAELRVDIPLRGDKRGALVPVIWRKWLGDLQIYDAAENARGIALLRDKHKGRYWLRADKFEPIEQLETVKKLVAGAGPMKDTQKKVPTFDEWVKAGRPLPEGMMFTGGTPWFNERTGKNRSPEEVYRMIFDQADAKKPGKARSRFPAHWGDPPKVQTRDLRPLPGGYGKGSSTLANWIKQNMARDAREADKEAAKD